MSESEAAMTDEREKRERVFEAWAVVDRDGDLEFACHRRNEALDYAERVEMYIGFRILPCRVIVEDEP